MTKRNITKRRRRKRKLKYKQKGGMDAAKSGPFPDPSGVHQRQHGTNFVTVEVMESALTSLRAEVFAAAADAGEITQSQSVEGGDQTAAGLGLVVIERFVLRIRQAIDAGSELPSPAPAPAPHVFDAVVVAGTPTSGKGQPPGGSGAGGRPGIRRIGLALQNLYWNQPATTVSDNPRRPQGYLVDVEEANHKIDLLAQIILMDVSQAMNGRLYGPNILEQFPNNWIEFYAKYLESHGAGTVGGGRRWPFGGQPRGQTMPHHDFDSIMDFTFRRIRNRPGPAAPYVIDIADPGIVPGFPLGETNGLERLRLDVDPLSHGAEGGARPEPY